MPNEPFSFFPSFFAWSQPVSVGPGKVVEAHTSKFGNGIFLLAAGKIYQLLLH
tara:strand:+ start:125 stop:283 length:159 start_codon:yes stop_codon:yes gene_type:complete